MKKRNNSFLLISLIIITLYIRYIQTKDNDPFALKKNLHINTNLDCAGVPNGNSKLDCAGVCGGHYVIDLCGVCNGRNISCTDCKGVLFGTSVKDLCGECDGKNECLDCKGIPFGNNVIDLCGVCGGNSTNCIGCDGIPNSGKLTDQCGICGGQNDCLDCAGVPWGESKLDRCQVCDGQDECVGCDDIPNSGQKLDSCGICGGDNSSCSGCDKIPYSETVFDSCGICGGDNSTCCSPEQPKLINSLRLLQKKRNTHVICGNHGWCDSTIKGCSCDLGWTGPFCTKNQGLCSGKLSVECNNHGTCDPKTGRCICDDSRIGLTCETPTCNGNGVFDTRQSRCMCLEGYRGEECDICGNPFDTNEIYICLTRQHFFNPEEIEAMDALPTLGLWKYYLTTMNKLYYSRKEVILKNYPNVESVLLNHILPNSTAKNGIYYDCSCRPHMITHSDKKKYPYSNINGPKSPSTLKFTEGTPINNNEDKGIDTEIDGFNINSNAFLSDVLLSVLISSRGVRTEMLREVEQTVDECKKDQNVILGIAFVLWPASIVILGIVVGVLFACPPRSFSLGRNM